MTTSADPLTHWYQDAVRDLRLIRAENKDELTAVAPTAAAAGPAAAQRVVLQELDARLEAVLQQLEPAITEPEAVLKRSLLALEELERLRFLLANLFEIVKRDGSAVNALLVFSQLGLLTTEVTLQEEKSRASPWPSSVGFGRFFLTKVSSRLKRAMLTVMELVLNAIKAVPKFIALKPKPSIGFTGLFPSISLTFDVEAESMTIHELFLQLKGEPS